MEKYVDILKEILDKEVDKASENYLDNYIQIAKGYKIDELTNYQRKVDELIDKFREAYKFNRDLCCDNEDERNKLEMIIFEIERYFIEENNNILYLIPLIICIDCECDLLRKVNSLYELNDFSKEQIKEKLSRFELNIELKDNLPDFDFQKILYNNYKEGLEKMDFERIYEFIDALDRNGRCYVNYFISICGIMLFKEVEDEFIDIVDGKKDLITIKPLIELLDQKDKLDLAYKSNNILVKFEILRQVLYFNKKAIDEISINKVSNVILNFTDDLELWEKFIKFYFNYPIRSPNFFKSLSLILCKLNKDKLDILCDNLILDKYDNIEKIKIINSCFTYKNLANPILKDNIKNIYTKWLEYVKNYKDFTNKIIYTDVIEIVIFYVCNYMPVNVFDEEYENCINLIKEINNVWYRDKSERITSLHKQLTILLVLGYRKTIDERREIYKELKENIFINENIIKVFNKNWIDRG